MGENLPRLVELSRRLGEPSLDLALLAEGNTSCRDGGNIWVKSSGASLHKIEESGFTSCRADSLLAALDRDLDDDQVRTTLEDCVVQGSRPSVEAFMHAFFLTLPGVSFVGHVHPTAVLSIVCSPNAQMVCSMRFFPDEVVCCGSATAWVPYVDPGLELAKKMRAVVTKFMADHGHPPKVVWMQNHGLTALGRTPEEVEAALLMNTKVCRIIGLAGGLTAIGKDNLVPLSPGSVARIQSRSDEHYRQSKLWGTGLGD
ncbi:MAG: class II aldolase [Armatimonadetes bacterium]|nr:class II aldolase [Armatimonadota bacterium]